MTLYHPHENEQIIAIKYNLETAPKVQKQLKEKFGYGENMFFDLDLIEYRIHNSCKDIAEDLDVKSLYDVSDRVAEDSVGRAFRGYHDKEFLPEFQFEGLFGEQLNELIEERRHSITGKIYGRKGGRKGAEAQGKHIWSLDELISLHEIREESIGKGPYKTSPCWTYVTEEFNERHGTELTKKVLNIAYSDNKHRLSEAGVEIAEPFWSLDKLVSLHKIREESFGKGRKKTQPCMNYVTEEFNRQHGTELTKKALKHVYSRNNHRLSEEE